MRVPVEERFWAKVDPGLCWVWTAAKVNGYGYFQMAGRAHQAHRVAWELLVGPIPDGLHIDHLCRNRACVNPDHLEPVTVAENIRRGFNATDRAKVRTHCPQGHAYDRENTHVTKQGKRHCRACDRDRHRAVRQFEVGP